MKRTILLVVCALFMVVMMSGVALSAEKKAIDQETMITGTINDTNQLVDKDGQAFGVADNEQGKELLTHVGEVVEVKGTVMESEGQKQIDVSAYKVIKK
jgi:TolA-binding protein